MTYTIYIAGKRFCSYKNLNDAHSVLKFLRQFYKFKSITIREENVK